MDTGLCCFQVCLIWGDVSDGGVDPLPIVVAFNVSEQVAPRGIAIGIFALVDKLGFRVPIESTERSSAKSEGESPSRFVSITLTAPFADSGPGPDSRETG